jgi:hypothetical protein
LVELLTILLFGRVSIPSAFVAATLFFSDDFPSIPLYFLVLIGELSIAKFFAVFCFCSVTVERDFLHLSTAGTLDYVKAVINFFCHFICECGF